MSVQPPFSYFGGKRRVADRVWSHFGNVKRYIEPFAGGLAVFLNRPEHRPYGDEIINDVDGLLTNAWRGIKYEPETIVDLLNGPVCELDLHAWARELDRRENSIIENLRSDPKWYDIELAGKWLWGKCYWKGSDWPNKSKRRPKFCANAIMSPSNRDNRERWISELSERLEDTVISCKDWRKCLSSRAVREGRSANRRTPTGIFLDPPYSEKTDRSSNLYNEDSITVAEDVRDWCLEHGDNKNYRIAVCGYKCEHEVLEREGWKDIAWKALGCGNASGNNNRFRETIWFSPGCLDQCN